MGQLLVHFFVNQIDKRYRDEQIVKYSLNMDSCRWDRLLENFSNYSHVNRFRVSVVIFIQNKCDCWYVVYIHICANSQSANLQSLELHLLPSIMGN